MKKLKLNVRLLRRIQKALLKEPSQFNMEQYFNDRSTTKRKPANCGTAACIGGWAYALSKNLNPSKARVKYLAEHGFMGPIASRLLGLGTGDKINEHALLYLEQWPQPFRTNYSKAKTDRAAARAAVDRIEHLIKTGE